MLDIYYMPYCTFAVNILTSIELNPFLVFFFHPFFRFKDFVIRWRRVSDFDEDQREVFESAVQNEGARQRKILNSACVLISWD